MERAFTFVLPLHNGGKYLHECVRSIQAQTYARWNLAVLEDSSTDGSVDWLRHLKDDRIVIYPSASRLSIAENWRRAAQVPKHEFFTITGQDDLFAPKYLQVMNALIDEHPDAGLYQTHFDLIDSQGARLGRCSPQPTKESAAEFLSARFQQTRESFGTGYMMRSADYARVGGIPPFEKLLYADDALWILLMQHSYKATAPESCFSYRSHSSSTSAAASWESLAKGARQYIEFLRPLREEDALLEQAWQSHSGTYFLSLCRLLYLLALVRSTKAGHALPPHELQEIQELLRLAAPQHVGQLTTTRSLAARRFINTNPAARALYRLYIRLRHQ